LIVTVSGWFLIRAPKYFPPKIRNWLQQTKRDI
jgi:hypothetical protein